jgi:hypothetical protein
LIELLWPAAHVPAAVFGLASAPVPTAFAPLKHALWEQQKFAAGSVKVPELICPVGQVPPAVFGIASVPVPTSVAPLKHTF